MKNKLFILILIVCNLLTAYVSGEVPPAKVVFQQYMNRGHKHLPTTFHGRRRICILTIRVITSEIRSGSRLMSLLLNNRLSVRSVVPLYVELVDQTGHIADKQIIKLTQGEGNGQFILPLPCYPAITRYVPIPAGCLLLMNHSTFRALFPFIN